MKFEYISSVIYLLEGGLGLLQILLMHHMPANTLKKYYLTDLVL